MKDPDILLLQMQALANPVRLWIITQLYHHGEQYVSELARVAKISRPLLKMHLKKLEDAGLVVSEIRTAENGKSANFYRVTPFNLSLNPRTIARTNPKPTSLANQNNGDENA